MKISKYMLIASFLILFSLSGFAESMHTIERARTAPKDGLQGERAKRKNTAINTPFNTPVTMQSIFRMTSAEVLSKAKSLANPSEDIEIINALFLQLQRLRLKKEIAELKVPTKSEAKRPWIIESRRLTLEVKRKSLEEIETAWKQIEEKKGPVRPFENLQSIYDFNRKGQKVTESIDLPGVGSPTTISKKSYDGGGRDYSGSPSGQFEPYDLSKMLNDIRRRNERRNVESLEVALESELEKKPVNFGHKPEWLASLDVLPNKEAKDSQGVQMLLQNLGKENTKVRSAALDLSELFPPPSLQGETFGCVGHATAINASAGRSSVPAISGKNTYYALTNNRGDEVPITSVKNALASLKGKPIPTEEGGKGSYMIQEFQAVEDKPTANDFRKLLSATEPPILQLATDGRQYVEDYIVPKSGSVRHVLNLVGYGRGMDPRTGAEGNYFVVMDSFATRKSTYKITEKELLENTIGLYRVTKVQASPR